MRALALAALCIVVSVALSFGGPTAAFGAQAPHLSAQVQGVPGSLGAASDAPGVSGAPASGKAPSVVYRASSDGKKWARAKANGKKAAATPVRSIRVRLGAGALEGGVEYKVRVSGKGWSKRWLADGAAASSGKGRFITGIKVRLVGEVAQRYDVLYRVRDGKAGWDAWTFNGRAAKAPSGLGAFWIKLKEKGTVKKVPEGAYFLRSASKPGVALEDPKGTGSKGAQMRAAKAQSGTAQKFYVRDEGHGLVSLQVVASGLFLGTADGKVVQRPDSDLADMRWKAVWDDGFSFVNASSGAALALAGGKAKSGAAAIAVGAGGDAGRWVLVAARLVSNGYYQVKSAVGTFLDVKGGSYGSGANIDASARNTTGAQVFRIAEKSNGNYYIENARSFLVIGVKGSSKADKANVVQQEKTGQLAQLWKPGLDRSGNLVFKNGRSGKVLEVSGSSKRSGANVRQGKASGAPGQQWRLVRTKRYSLSGNGALDRDVARVLRTHGNLRAAYNWTVAHPYREGQRYYSNPRVLPDSRTSILASDFFKYGSGNCYRFAAAFSWLARGLGYQTNVISGWVQAAGGGQAPHGWVEVVQDGRTYVCDPDMQHEMPGYNWYMQTYATSPTVYHNW